MLADFFVRALLGGVGVALTAGPLGCLVVWRRMAYFGDTLAHAALLGVALAVAFQINNALAVFLTGSLIATALVLLQRKNFLSNDSLLGILSHSSLALGLVVLSLLTFVRVDIMALLFGDILTVSSGDVWLIFIGGSVVLSVVAMNWRSLLASTLSHELAAAEGLKPERSQWVLVFLLAAVMAMAMKVVGVLLITALMIIPAATARRLARTPERMAAMASLCGSLSVIAGLFLSLWFDTPAGPSIVLCAAILFSLALTPLGRGLAQWKN